MRRSLEPYVRIMEAYASGRIGAAKYCSKLFHQYHEVDDGVRWATEWDTEMADIVYWIGADLDVFLPESPEDSHITEKQLLRSVRKHLARLHEALRRRGLDPRG